MKRPLMLIAALLAGGLTVPAHASCAHLLTDPVGDVHETGANPSAPIEDTRQVDLTSADLTGSARTITAVLHVASLDPESKPFEAHYYDVGFSTERARFYLMATRGGYYHDQFSVTHLFGGTDAPEDQYPSPGAAETLGDARGRFDERAGTITITAPLSLFESQGGLHGPLTKIRATTGAGTQVPGVEAYELADGGRTEGFYRPGSRGCQ
jgi:hypothetical protein